MNPTVWVASEWNWLWTTVGLMSVVFGAGALNGFEVGLCCYRKTERREQGAKRSKKVFHDLEVQGPVWCVMHYEEPEFAAQSGSQWGVWARSPSSGD